MDRSLCALSTYGVETVNFCGGPCTESCVQAVGLSDESGRGLQLVELLADEWGVIERRFGTPRQL